MKTVFNVELVHPDKLKHTFSLILASGDVSQFSSSPLGKTVIFAMMNRVERAIPISSHKRCL